MVFDKIGPDFLRFISDLSLTDLINAVTAGKFAKDALKNVKDKIKQKQLEGTYLFTPSPENLKVIKSLEDSVTYQRAKELLSMHPSFTLLRLGLYINRLSESGRKEKIGEVRSRVHEKYGQHGLSVISIVSTGELDYVLDDLSEVYQRIGNKIKIIKLFDHILAKWGDITIFVKKENTKEEIEKKIKDQISRENPYFFVFSYGSASKIAYMTMAKMDNSGFFKKKEYIPQLRRKKKNEDYAWVIENTKKDIFLDLE